MPTHDKGIQGAGWLNIVLGLLIIATPYMTGDTGTTPLWNGIIAGVIVIALAGYNAYTASQHHSERALAPAALNVLVGLWVLFSGFFMAVSQAYVWTMVVWGAILVVSAGYNTWAASDARTSTRAM